MTLTLGLAYWAVSLLVAVFLFTCVVMMLTVLIQRPQGGGLSGAFGSGGGAGQTAFGTKTGDALTIATIIMFVVFLGLAVGLNYATRPENIGAGQGAVIEAAGAEGTTGVDQPEGEPAPAGGEDAPVVIPVDPGELEGAAEDTGVSDAPAENAGGAEAPAGEPETPAGETPQPGGG